MNRENKVLVLCNQRTGSKNLVRGMTNLLQLKRIQNPMLKEDFEREEIFSSSFYDYYDIIRIEVDHVSSHFGMLNLKSFVKKCFEKGFYILFLDRRQTALKVISSFVVSVVGQFDISERSDRDRMNDMDFGIIPTDHIKSEVDHIHTINNSVREYMDENDIPYNNVKYEDLYSENEFERVQYFIELLTNIGFTKLNLERFNIFLDNNLHNKNKMIQNHNYYQISNFEEIKEEFDLNV